MSRFLPILTPLLVIILAEIYFFWPRLIYAVVIISALIFFFSTKQLIKKSHYQDYWLPFLILPLCFFIGLITFSVLLPNNYLIQLLFFLNLFFLYLYFHTMYHYLHDRKGDIVNSWRNFSAFGNFLSMFFIASSIYGLQSFLDLEVWPLMLILTLVATLLSYQVIWANQIKKTESILFILLVSLFILEIAWSISFLPLNFYILGLFLALCYYMIIGLIRFYLLGSLNKKTVKVYLSFGFVGIILILFTARWL